jgi:uncharacterized membrane protein
MSFNRSLRHHTVRANTLFPFFDAIFSVVLTLLAFNIPTKLSSNEDYSVIAQPVLAYALTSIILILYWFKLRRLIGLCRFLHVPQLLCIAQAVLIICLFPKLANLVLLHGSEPGSIFLVSRGQIVNSVYLLALFAYNALCLLFAWSLTTHHYYKKANESLLGHIIGGQLFGFLALVAMICAEIFWDKFNNQYIFLVPVVLILEELMSASWRSSSRRA